MSWSVSASGKPEEVKSALTSQFAAPLDVAPRGLSDEGEKETVRRVCEIIIQCLGTFGPDRNVSVSANGHMGYEDWDTKSGAYQVVNVTIK